MTCQETKTLIPIFLEDGLDAEAQQRVADHLRTCADCRVEARKIEQAWALLDAVKAIKPDPSYRIRFWRSVDARRPWHTRAWQQVQTLLGNRRWLPAAAAAAIVLLIGGVAVFQLSEKPPQPAVLAAPSEIDLEMLAKLDMVEDFEIIQEFDFFTDFEIIIEYQVRIM